MKIDTTVVKTNGATLQRIRSKSDGKDDRKSSSNEPKKVQKVDFRGNLNDNNGKVTAKHLTTSNLRKEIDDSYNQSGSLSSLSKVINSIPESRQHTYTSNHEEKFTALGSLTHYDLGRHVYSLRTEYIQRLARPIIQRLMVHSSNKNMFNAPVDPIAQGVPNYFDMIKRPMDLGTVKGQLHKGHYKSIYDCFSDIELVFQNALDFNSPELLVHKAAKELLAEFRAEVDAMKDKCIKENEKKQNHSCSLCCGALCLVCGEKCLKFEAPVLVCSGPCGAKVKKNTTFYIADDGGILWCQKCYNSLPPIVRQEYYPPPANTGTDSDQPAVGAHLYKKQLLKRRSDEEVAEPWVECDDCGYWVHQICALYNDLQQNAPPSPTAVDSTSTDEQTAANSQYRFICPLCRLDRCAAAGASELQLESASNNSSAKRQKKSTGTGAAAGAAAHTKSSAGTGRRSSRLAFHLPASSSYDSGGVTKVVCTNLQREVSDITADTGDFAGIESSSSTENMDVDGDVRSVTEVSSSTTSVDGGASVTVEDLLRLQEQISRSRSDTIEQQQKQQLRDNVTDGEKDSQSTAAAGNGGEEQESVGARCLQKLNVNNFSKLDEPETADDDCTSDLSDDDSVQCLSFAEAKQRLEAVFRAPAEQQRKLLATGDTRTRVVSIDGQQLGTASDNDAVAVVSPDYGKANAADALAECPVYYGQGMPRVPEVSPKVSFSAFSHDGAVSGDQDDKSAAISAAADLSDANSMHNDNDTFSGVSRDENGDFAGTRRSQRAYVPKCPLADDVHWKWRASSLPRTQLGDFLELMVRELLTSSGYADVADSVTVRMTSNCDHCMQVPKGVVDNMVTAEGNAVPEHMGYRQKCILLFQTVEGADVCLFCLYVQEYDAHCPAPNTSTVYIAYLDSVDYFRPVEARTLVYHEVIVAYLKWSQSRGFKSAHIWSCPPQRGDNFIFWLKPPYQRTPSRDRLNGWYNEILLRCSKLGFLADISSLYEAYFEEYNQISKKEDVHPRAAAKNSFVGTGQHQLKAHGCSGSSSLNKSKSKSKSKRPVVAASVSNQSLLSENSVTSIDAISDVELSSAAEPAAVDSVDSMLVDAPLEHAPDTVIQTSETVDGGVTELSDVRNHPESLDTEGATTCLSIDTNETSNKSCNELKSLKIELPEMLDPPVVTKQVPVAPPVFDGDFWLQEYDRISRQMTAKPAKQPNQHTEPSLLQDKPPGFGSKQSHRRKCREILKRICNKNASSIFMHPVDPIALSIPTYFNVVKEPMDLSTVKEKLTDSKYSTVLDFAKDMRLIFRNAMLFNPSGHYVHGAALSMLRDLQHYLEEYVNTERNSKNVPATQPIQTTMTVAEEEGQRLILPTRSNDEIALNDTTATDVFLATYMLVGESAVSPIGGQEEATMAVTSPTSAELQNKEAAVCATITPGFSLVSTPIALDPVPTPPTERGAAHPAMVSSVVDVEGPLDERRRALTATCRELGAVECDAANESLLKLGQQSPGQLSCLNNNHEQNFEMLHSGRGGHSTATPLSSAASQPSSTFSFDFALDDGEDCNSVSTMNTGAQVNPRKRTLSRAYSEDMSLYSATDFSRTNSFDCSVYSGMSVSGLYPREVRRRDSMDSICSASFVDNGTLPTPHAYGGGGYVRPFSSLHGGGLASSASYANIQAMARPQGQGGESFFESYSQNGADSGVSGVYRSFMDTASSSHQDNQHHGPFDAKAFNLSLVRTPLDRPPVVGYKTAMSIMHELSKCVQRLKDDLFVIHFADPSVAATPCSARSPHDTSMTTESSNSHTVVVKDESGFVVPQLPSANLPQQDQQFKKKHRGRAAVFIKKAGPKYRPPEQIPASCLVLLRGLKHDTSDPDALIYAPFLNSRHTLLEMCQYRHYQFDSLRRAKHSSMMLIYHLQNPFDKSTRIVCSVCKVSIQKLRWHCDQCANFDICDDCRVAAMKPAGSKGESKKSNSVTVLDGVCRALRSDSTPQVAGDVINGGLTLQERAAVELHAHPLTPYRVGYV